MNTEMNTNKKSVARKGMKIETAILVLGLLILLPHPHAFADDPVPVVDVIAPVAQVQQVVQVMNPIAVSSPTVSVVPINSGSDFFAPSSISVSTTPQIDVVSVPTTSDSQIISTPVVTSPSVSTVALVDSATPVTTLTTPSTVSSTIDNVNTPQNIPLTSSQAAPALQAVRGKLLATLKRVNLHVGTKDISVSQALHSIGRDAQGVLKTTKLDEKRFLTVQARANHLTAADEGSASQVGKLGNNVVSAATDQEKSLLIATHVVSIDEANRVFKRRIEMPSTGSGRLKSYLVLYYMSPDSLPVPSQASSSPITGNPSTSAITNVPAAGGIISAPVSSGAASTLTTPSTTAVSSISSDASSVVSTPVVNSLVTSVPTDIPSVNASLPIVSSESSPSIVATVASPSEVSASSAPVASEVSPVIVDTPTLLSASDVPAILEVPTVPFVPFTPVFVVQAVQPLVNLATTVSSPDETIVQLP